MKLGLGVVAVLWMTACGSSGGEIACPTNSTLTYDNFGKGFMTTYCISCHSTNSTSRNGAPTDQNFETQALVQAHLTEINDESGEKANGTVNTDMPDGDTQPTDAERKQLGEWLACGAK